jgi:hypothetical protein
MRFKDSFVLIIPKGHIDGPGSNSVHHAVRIDPKTTRSAAAEILNSGEYPGFPDQEAHLRTYKSHFVAGL